MINPVPKPSPDVHPTDPRYQQALDDYAAEWGIRFEDVFLPTMWRMLDVDGRAEICFNADGVRALALMAPGPNAQRLADQIIAGPLRGDRYP